MRLAGSCVGCPSSAVTLRYTNNDAVDNIHDIWSLHHLRSSVLHCMTQLYITLNFSVHDTALYWTLTHVLFNN